ncbi:MAG: HAD family phosphatase [Bryobacteraceae bacterium]
MRIRPKAVILDYGNVLSRPQPQTEVERMAAVLEFPTDRFRESYWRYRVVYDEAALEPAAYWQAVAGRPIPDAELEGLIEIDCASWAHPAPSVPEWARRLRQAGFQAALLSNMPVPVRDYIQTCDWLPRFDHRTFSCDLGISRPSPGMYRHSLDGLGVEPNQALFLDDRPENVRAAEAMGIHAVLFTTADEVAAELEHRFDIPALLVATLEEGDEKNQ